MQGTNTPPAKAKYQLFPNLGVEELRKLEESILAHGVQHPISVDVDGEVLDGHHRLAICAKNEIDCPRRVVDLTTEDEKTEFVLTMNLARRHLTPMERIDYWNRLRKLGKSYREIAEITNVPKSTVQRQMEAAGVEQPKTIVGQDGKVRNATVDKPKKVTVVDPTKLPPMTDEERVGNAEAGQEPSARPFSSPKTALENRVAGFVVNPAGSSASMGDSQPRKTLPTPAALCGTIIAEYSTEQIEDVIAMLQRHLGINEE